jgi:hypothetical protein
MESAKKYEEENISFFTSQRNLFKLLIITATKVEKETLQKHIQPLPGKHLLSKVHEGKQTYYLGIFGQYRVVHVACGERVLLEERHQLLLQWTQFRFVSQVSC